MKDVFEALFVLLSRPEPAVLATLFTGLLTLGLWMVKGIKWLYLWGQQKRIASDLHPFYSYDEVKKHTRFFVQPFMQNIPPSIHEEPIEAAMEQKGKIVPFFLKKAFRQGKDRHKYYIVLADSGMGKTALMINLCLPSA